MSAQTILTTEATKTEKIIRLLGLGYSRRQIATMLQVGYGFVQNVFAKLQQTDGGKFGRYIKLQAEIAERQEELKALAEELLPIADGKEIFHETDNTNYVFCVKSRRTFGYSETVKTLEAELKAKKDVEEANGTATVTKTTDYISVYKR